MSRRAKQAARDILDRAGYTVPVDVRAIARDLGLVIRAQGLEDEVSGMLVVKEGRGLIGLNAAHHEHRQRFTIAHEIGHYLLHRTAATVFIDAPVFFRSGASSEGTERQEIEANAFASELLMPEQVVRDRFGHQPFDAYNGGEASIACVARELDVSVQALTIRLTRLGLISA